jgi:hypothetical protein
MSNPQTVWMLLWNHAAKNSAPFEVGELALDVAKTIGVSESEAQRRISGLLKELGRLPEGQRFFNAEGNAVVPLPEFLASAKDDATARASYPFEY